MRRLEHEVPHDDLDIELLADFAAERCDMRFAIRNFATREFPESGQVDAVLPPCHEKSILPRDDGGDDEDSRHYAGL